MKRLLFIGAFLFASLSLLLSSNVVSAQFVCQPLVYGQIVAGNITNADTNFIYCFEGNAGDTVRITMTAVSGDLDTYLYLNTDDGNLYVTEDDDGAGNLNSAIEITLSRTTTYDIDATRYSGGSTTGIFELELELISSSGSTNSGNSGSSAPVSDADSDGFADNVDGCPTSLGGFPDGCTRPSSDGDMFNDNIDNCPTTPGPDMGCPLSYQFPDSFCPAELQYPDTITSIIDATLQQQDYCFYGFQGDEIEIRMTRLSDNLETQLRLYDINGNPIDDNAGGSESVIYFTVPTEAAYAIQATSEFTGNPVTTIGIFELSINFLGASNNNTSTNNTNNTPPNNSNGSISNLPTRNNPSNIRLDASLPPNYGDVVLEAGFQPDPYRINILSGGSVDAFADIQCAGFATSQPDFNVVWGGDSSNLRLFFVADPLPNSNADTTLIIQAPDGTYSCNDDSFQTLNPSLDIVRPDEGTYAVWVGSYQQDENIHGTLYVTELDYTPENLPEEPVVGVQCPNTLPSQFVNGDIARVGFEGVANRVRSGPGLNYEQVGRLEPGAIFEVIGGPLCGSGYTWYQVIYGRNVGWTAEASPTEYWIDPVR